MKLYTFVVHYLQMCMKEYGCCPKFRRRDNSTYTFTKRGGMYLVSATPTKLLIYDVQTLEYRYISKLPMKNEQIWSYVKETTSHLQNKLTKNIHLGNSQVCIFIKNKSEIANLPRLKGPLTLHS
jgi:hypothetical protein